MEEIGVIKHFAQSGLWLLDSAQQQCLGWPGLSETGLRVATFREWLASVCGGPRERERERERRRPRDESGNQRAGQRPPGQTIRGPLHYIYLNILQPIVCTVFLCNLLDPPSDVKQDSSSIQGQNRTILQEIPYQSLPWGAHYNKVYRTYLVESILLPFCCMFLNTIRPGHHHVDGFQDLCLCCVFDFICYLRFIVTPKNNLLQLTASNVVYLVIPVIGLLAWDGHQF